MIPGTTHRVRIEVPMDVLNIADFKIVVSQNGRKVIEKDKKHCDFNRRRVICYLEPSDTKKLSPYYRYATIQGFGITNLKDRFATKPEKIKIEDAID